MHTNRDKTKKTFTPFTNKTDKDLKNGFWTREELMFAANWWKTTTYLAEQRLFKGEKPE